LQVWGGGREDGAMRKSGRVILCRKSSEGGGGPGQEPTCPGHEKGENRLEKSRKQRGRKGRHEAYAWWATITTMR